MPLSKAKKREYMRRYMRKRRMAYKGGDRESEGKGVRPPVRPSDTMLDPTREREDVRPTPIPMNPRTMSKRKLVGYLAHVGRLGFSLVETSRGYELGANTGNLVPFDGVAVLESEMHKMREAQVVDRQLITRLESDMARLEAMLDSVLYEAREES